MLKKILIQGREIPVPIPILNVEDAIQWVEETLVIKGCILTKVMIDGQDLLPLSASERKSIQISNSQVPEFSVDSPKDLSIQSLDVVRDLSYAVARNIPETAVKSWNYLGDTCLKEISDAIDDLGLVVDLINHINGLLDYTHVEMAPVNGLKVLIVRYHKDMQKSVKERDWKSCSRILVGRLEAYLRELVSECEKLQLRIISSGLDDFIAEQAKIV